MSTSTNPSNTGALQVIVDGVTVFDSTETKVTDSHIVDLIRQNLPVIPPALTPTDVNVLIQNAMAQAGVISRDAIVQLIKDNAISPDKLVPAVITAIESNAELKRSFLSAVAGKLTS